MKVKNAIEKLKALQQSTKDLEVLLTEMNRNGLEKIPQHQATRIDSASNLIANLVLEVAS